MPERRYVRIRPAGRDGQRGHLEVNTPLLRALPPVEAAKRAYAAALDVLDAARA